MWCGLELLMFFGLLSVSQVYFSWFYKATLFKQDEGNGTSLPMLCYFALDASWPDNGTLHPSLNATLCTHIIFIPTTIIDCQVTLLNPDDGTKYFGKIPLLLQQNPNLKFLVSNGGAGGHPFDPVLESAENRTRFFFSCGSQDKLTPNRSYRQTVQTLIRQLLQELSDLGLHFLQKTFIDVCIRFVQSIFPFLQRYGLDGLDMDWEFPGWNGRPKEQRKNFTMLLQQIRNAFDDHARTGKKYQLSAAVAAGRSVMESYDVPALAKSLDWINLMCYDLHSYNLLTPWTNHNSPLYPTDWWKKIVILAGNIGWSSYTWHQRGMPKSKIMVGLPTYTHTYTLEMPEKYHGLYAPAIGVGKSCDECSFPFVCDFLKSGATEVFDEDAYVPYAYKGAEWVSYDNVKSLAGKTQWIKLERFGGVMVYSMNSDDASGSCGTGKFPLLSAIRGVLNNQQNGQS